MLFVQSLLLDMENELSWSLGSLITLTFLLHILIMMYRNTHGNALSEEERKIKPGNMMKIISLMLPVR